MGEPGDGDRQAPTMQEVQVQMDGMMNNLKAEQCRQMEIFKAQMKAQKELNRFLTSHFIGKSF
jgi:ABC-type uncharacterized transport system auxiliary subunit